MAYIRHGSASICSLPDKLILKIVKMAAECRETVLPDGNSQILRLYVFGPSGFWTMAPLCYAAKFDPFLSLDCAPTPSTLVPQALHPGAIQGKEGIKFSHLATLILHPPFPPQIKEAERPPRGHLLADVHLQERPRRQWWRWQQRSGKLQQ